MSRDSRDRRDAADAETALLTAYIDGVAELSPEERHRIEARLARDPDSRGGRKQPSDGVPPVSAGA